MMVDTALYLGNSLQVRKSTSLQVEREKQCKSWIMAFQPVQEYPKFVIPAKAGIQRFLIYKHLRYLLYRICCDFSHF